MKDQKMILLILEHKVAQHRNPVWHQWTAILIRDTIIKVKKPVYPKESGSKKEFSDH